LLFLTGRNQEIDALAHHGIRRTPVTIKPSFFSERERSRSLYAVARPSVVCLSVTLVRPTQAVEIFGNISTAFGTLAIR